MDGELITETINYWYFKKLLENGIRIWVSNKDKTSHLYWKDDDHNYWILKNDNPNYNEKFNSIVDASKSLEKSQSNGKDFILIVMN